MADFDELTPAALDAMIEGQQKARIDAYNWQQQVQATSLYPVVMVGEEGAKQIDDNANKLFQSEKANIETQHQQTKAPSKENISAIERYQAFLNMQKRGE